MIKLQNLSKTYITEDIHVEALRNVSLTVEAGDIYGIIGLSGAGKSTLIRCINRLEEPDSGSIEINGKEITLLENRELRDIRKKIGMIFQHFNLLSSRTVADNIAYSLEIAGANKIARTKRIDELLELVGLADKRNAYPSQLSGGQKQRVGIARALANHPEVLLCDEATSALDPLTTKSILSLLKQINKKLGLTIIIITHEMSVIKNICTNVAVMDNGKIVEKASVVDIFAHPKHATTKSFVQNIIHDIPEYFYNIDDNTKQLVHLSFKGNKTKQPVLSRAIKTFDIEANILLGNIDHLQEMIIGNMIIELSGPTLEIKKAVKYLIANNVDCEVIY